MGYALHGTYIPDIVILPPPIGLPVVFGAVKCIPHFKYKELLTSFIKFESNGPFDYDAPILSDNKINSLFGEVDNYSIPEAIPRVEEYWVDSLVFNLPVRFKIGHTKLQSNIN